MKLEIGQNYLVESGAKEWVGRLVSVDGLYVVTLVDYAWVSDSGRYYSNFLADGKAPEMEIEPAPDGVERMFTWTNIGQWPHPLLRERV